jgi:DnaD/phage-associated family protein
MSNKDFDNSEKNLQDKRRTNWFWDTNEVFNSDLSPFAKLVRLYLARCANSKRQAFPSYNKIHKDCRISRDTAKRAVAELEEKGWIVKNHQVREGGEHISNIYFLCDPPEPEKEAEKIASKSANDDIEEGGCSQHLPCHNNDVEEGRCSQHPPCQNLEGVGADSTQVGAHSTGVGAVTASNNTHLTIPIKQETFIHPSIHHDKDNNARAREISQAKEALDSVDDVDNLQRPADDINSNATTLKKIESLLKAAGFEGTVVEVEFIGRWADLLSLEMIEYAVKKSVLNGIKSLPYISGIFEDWKKKGVRTIKQAEKETRYDNKVSKYPKNNIKQGHEKEITIPDTQAFRDYVNRHSG